MEKSIRVRILDKSYPLKVREEEEEQTLAIAKKVDGRMQEIRKRIPGEPETTVAVLVALSIAEELEKARASARTKSEAVRNEADSMIDKLSSVV